MCARVCVCVVSVCVVSVCVAGRRGGVSVAGIPLYVCVVWCVCTNTLTHTNTLIHNTHARAQTHTTHTHTHTHTLTHRQRINTPLSMSFALGVVGNVRRSRFFNSALGLLIVADG